MGENDKGADWRDERMMIQHGEHIEEHESLEEDGVHSVHDEPFLESQLEAHVESMMEQDEKSSFGQTIDEEQIDAQATGRAAVLLGNNPLQEYIDRAFNMVFPLVPILGRGRFSRWILLIDQAELHELDTM